MHAPLVEKLIAASWMEIILRIFLSANVHKTLY